VEVEVVAMIMHQGFWTKLHLWSSLKSRVFMWRWLH